MKKEKIFKFLEEKTYFIFCFLANLPNQIFAHLKNSELEECKYRNFLYDLDNKVLKHYLWAKRIACVLALIIGILLGLFITCCLFSLF